MTSLPPRQVVGPAAGIWSGVQMQAISVDLDDTLWPIIPALVEAEHSMHRWLAEHAPATAALCSIERLKELRIVLAMANAERAHDMAWLRLESLRRALGEAGDDQALAVGAFQVFMDGRQRVTLYDEVEKVLRRWKSRYKLLAVTNGNADLRRVGIAHYFDAIVAAHEIGFGKPDPRIFHQACAEAGVEPTRVLHIGDDLELDVLAARRAGMHAAWLRRADVDARLPGRDANEATAGSSSSAAAAVSEPFYRDLEEVDQALAEP